MSVRKLVISLLLLIIGLFLTTTPSLAQTNPSTSPSAAIKPLGVVNPQSPQYINLQVINLMHTIGCLLSGTSQINQPCVEYVIDKNTQSSINTVPVLSSVNLSGGVLGTVSAGLALLYTNPPIKSIDYLSSLWDSFSFFEIRGAHAQVEGSGSEVLRPILRLWRVSRNIAYIAIIIIFVVVGVMVMFRNRINPQTVVTIQTALPGLVISLVLITFSYFLASLITDIAFVGSNIVGHYFTIAQSRPIPVTGPVDTLRNENMLSILSRFLATTSKEQFIPLFQTIFDNLPTPAALDPLAPARMFGYVIVGLVTQITSLLGLPGVIGVPLNAFTGAKGLSDGQATGSFLVWLILIIVLMYSMFRVLYRLVISYLTIIFLTITAPFTFLVAAFPGRQDIAINWARNMLANILAFPGVLAMFYFAGYLLGPTLLTTAGGAGGITLNNLLNIHNRLGVSGTQTLPLLGGLDQTTIQLILAYGALIAAPSIPEIITNAIGKTGPAGQIIGREITGAIQSGRGYLQQGAGAVGGAFGRGVRR